MNQLPLIEQSPIQGAPPFIVSTGDAYEVFRRIAWTFAHQRLKHDMLMTCWRPFDGLPRPDRKFWSAQRIHRAIEQLLAEGAIVWTHTDTGDAYQATDFGLKKYRRSA